MASKNVYFNIIAEDMDEVVQNISSKEGKLHM